VKPFADGASLAEMTAWASYAITAGFELSGDEQPA
jgi:hypothetical protein